MKKLEENTIQNIFALTISGLILVSMWFIYAHFKDIAVVLTKLFKGLAPFFYGFLIILLVNPIHQMVENKWLVNVKWKPKSKRIFSVFLSELLLILIVISFFWVLIPQLIESVTMLVKSMDTYMTTFQKWIEPFFQDANAEAFIETAYEQFRSYLNTAITGTASILTQVVSYSVTLLSSVMNAFIGVIVSVYILLDKEKVISSAKCVIFAFLPEGLAKWFVDVGHLSTQMLNRFIFGKALDSLIVGIVCYLFTSFMKIPYSTLISFIVGITNMIPVFGPFIGGIPSAFILLIIRPLSALEFTVFVIILQQVDGNILGPYILGDSLGLKPIWIMFAILVGGSLFGVVGMFLGVPVFAVAYTLVQRFIADRLSKKQIEF